MNAPVTAVRASSVMPVAFRDSAERRAFMRGVAAEPAPHGATPAEAETARLSPHTAETFARALADLETDVTALGRAVRRIKARLRGAV